MSERKKESTFTPRELVGELDRYIIGQHKAKRAVAIALRNRWRRQRVSDDIRDEIMPKNIIMIGPTGVGKTEIARRLAKLVNAPFLKVEASKFTEVGYVGRDVDSMIRDLTEIAVNLVRKEHEEAVHAKASKSAEERLLDLLVPPPVASKKPAFEESGASPAEAGGSYADTREKFRRMLRDGKLDERTVSIEVAARAQPPVFELFGGPGTEEVDSNIKDLLGSMMPRRRKNREVPVKEALELLVKEEAEKLVDMEGVQRDAVERVEETGIIFLDEIDKIAGRDGGGGSVPDVSRQGVQRDILPIVEGSTVSTKHGLVRTHHILFVAAGAFHLSKPSDLIPELQGRFPIRVELDSLGKEEFIRILTEPRNALTIQYKALMETEGVAIEYDQEAVAAIAEVAAEANLRMENIGARRLHTIMELVLDELSFDATERRGDSVTIDQAYVRDRISDVLGNEDLSRYIL